MHLLIPFACPADPGCQQVLSALQLPALDALLRRLAPVHTDGGDEHSLTPPHERVLAHSLGIAAADGRVPWAAHALAQGGRDPGGHGWAWVSPVHWSAVNNQVHMADPSSLQITEGESRALLATMAPFFAEDGIELEYWEPQRWLARAGMFTELASASLDRVIGVDIKPWLPPEPMLRRLHTEMQMLLYTDPTNDARSARGLAAVNAFWISGSGAYAGAATSAPMPTVVDGLRAPALRGDWTAWAQCWREIDQGACRALDARSRDGATVQLTLCSDTRAMQFASAADGWVARLRRRWRNVNLQSLQHQA